MQNVYRMINVGNKSVTERTAIACGSITVGREAFTLIKNRALPKGDVLMLAEIAGINNAKKAYEMIPLCHPLGLDHVEIRTELHEEENSIRVYCIASAHAKTGVEMEALAGVNGALLTIWDLAKMIEPALSLSAIRLLAKKGGKKGVWLNPQGVPDWIQKLVEPPAIPVLENVPCAVVTLSDRATRGEYKDESGALLQSLLLEAGADICSYAILPDEEEALIQKIRTLSGSARLIITTGGTGVSRRDITPETISKLCDRLIPGIGELLRANGAQFTQHSWSSRSLAGIMGKALIIALPGSTKAVQEGMDCLLPLIPHLLHTMDDKKHD